MTIARLQRQNQNAATYMPAWLMKPLMKRKANEADIHDSSFRTPIHKTYT